MVHRDLAARNCLLSGDMNSNFVVKISDFGLARNTNYSLIYSMSIDSSDRLPIRWLAPESVIDGNFSNKSDVW